MKKLLISLLLTTSLLGGCQSLGDHFNCMAQVDRIIPAQTQQRYVRTDTKCTSSGGAIATPTTTRGDQYIVNNNGQTNCTSTPIYETIVLNQPQRDAAYQQCRSNTSSQRNSQQSTLTSVSSQKVLSPDSNYYQELLKQSQGMGATSQPQIKELKPATKDQTPNMSKPDVLNPDSKFYQNLLKQSQGS